MTIVAFIDLDGFSVQKKFLCRELGYVTIYSNIPRSVYFDLRSHVKNLSVKDKKTIEYVQRNINGLPVYPQMGEKCHQLDELEEIIVKLYQDNRQYPGDEIAYKGGNVEKDLLQKLNIPAINLEEYGCPKYDNMTEKFFTSACKKHSFNLHCPRAEVLAFKHWFLRGRFQS